MVDNSRVMPVKSALMPETASDRICPIVKWAGGKSWLVDELIARLPQKFGRYYEPFGGGAALFLALADHTIDGHPVLGDANPDLIGMYQRVAADDGRLIAMLKTHKRYHSRAWYEATRDRFNARKHSTETARAAAFIYLNRTCFNGLYRVNGAGEFNVPMGRYVDPLICPEADLRAAAPILFNAILRCGDYRATVHDATRGDAVYLDPPYDAEDDDSFTAFTGGGFGRAQQRELAEFAARLRDRGVFVMLSNADTPRVRKLYAGWKIERIYRRGTINSKTSDRGKVAEVIITPR